MKVQNLGFKVGSTQKNSRSKNDRSVVSFDPIRSKYEHRARAAHRARLADLIANSQDY